MWLVRLKREVPRQRRAAWHATSEYVLVWAQKYCPSGDPVHEHCQPRKHFVPYDARVLTACLRGSVTREYPKQRYSLVQSPYAFGKQWMILLWEVQTQT